MSCLETFLSEMSLNVSLGLEKSVGGKYGRSREAPSVLFSQISLELLSIKHT
jgi:hypothetical protein